MTPLGNKLMINRAGHFGLDFEDRGCVRKLDCVALLALAADDDDDHDVANDRLFFRTALNKYHTLISELSLRAESGVL